jgi:hypothetical protein
MASSPVLEIISIETSSSTTILGSSTWLLLASSIKSHPLFAQAYYGFRVKNPTFLELAISMLLFSIPTSHTHLALPPCSQLIIS